VSIEQDVDVMKRQMLALRRQVQRQEEWIDTVSSPLWKRCWFVAQGWRFRQLGRWYPRSFWPRWCVRVRRLWRRLR
jgi:hypothetical protein